MTIIENRLADLAQKSAALEPNETTRNEWLKILQNYCNNYINTLSEQPAFVQKNTINTSDLQIDNEKKSFDNLLEIFTKQVIDNGIKPSSGGHVGYIPGGG
ncbi:MAG: hypothetical protein COX71_05325, partial [Flavobacteriales bacterium CG_4_10_14_0_2_um_filter_35_18]